MPARLRRLPALLLALAAVLLAPFAAADAADAPAAAAAAGPVVVAGAGGRTGRLVVRELVAAGVRVRALVRDPAGARFPAGVEVLAADARDPGTLAAPLTGASALVISIGARRAEAGNGPEQVDFGGVRNLATAAAAAGVGQVVLVSSAGVTREDHPLNRLFDDVLRWKARGEDAVRAAGVPYTIIRPGGLTDADDGPGAIRLDQGDDGTGFIPRADVARLCVAALREPAARNRSFEAYAAGGPAPVDYPRLFGALVADTPPETTDGR
jgi:uncharacterized protein YbjT (DUF2867 family)